MGTALCVRKPFSDEPLDNLNEEEIGNEEGIYYTHHDDPVGDYPDHLVSGWRRSGERTSGGLVHRIWSVNSG
jgi:hypothetical protein